jgi:exopolysaccharide biosynthesis WecB/TagA/CpsF family protein
MSPKAPGSAGGFFDTEMPMPDKMIDWPEKRTMFGVRMSATDYDQLVPVIAKAAVRRDGGAVTHLAVHGLVSAVTDSAYRARINEFDVIAPDGMPVRWAMNFFEKLSLPDRVYGPELMIRLCRHAAKHGIKVYLYGSTREVVEALTENLSAQLPHLEIVGAEPSLFRPLTAHEDKQLVRRINDSGAGLLFVGLGCPRQEIFAAEHRHTIKAVQMCVGAAFDFHAGNKSMAPRWLQDHGLEWLYRLTQEPGRLWRRYLFTNTTFCLLCMRRLLVGH